MPERIKRPVSAAKPDLPTHKAPAQHPRDSIAKPSERELLNQLRRRLPSMLDGQRGGRAERFYPYLLVRAKPGDHGDRPVFIDPNDESWGSPDIWIAKGAPAAAPSIPSDSGPHDVLANHTYTVYAHVWNLGRAPIVGATIAFYYFNNTYSDSDMDTDDANSILIGMTRVDLPPRSSLECHTLVKCPVPWVVPNVAFDAMNEHTFTLAVRLWGVGDRFSHQYRWDMVNDRRVGVLSTILGDPKYG